MRTRFLCDLLDAIEQERGAELVRTAGSRVCYRMEGLSGLDALRAAQPGDSIPIADAEQLLLGLDVLLGNGSGSVIEAAALQVYSRLLRRSSLTIHGDLMSTVMRMRAPIEYPFVDVALNWDIASSSTGFSVFMVVAQRPRAARIVKSLATGAVRAAHQNLNRGADSVIKIFSEVVADRVSIEVRIKAPLQSGLVKVSDSAPPSPFDSGKYATAREPQPTLREVERILSRRR